MKIVTAGHRGSVATGNEIRGAHNNRRRIFSYSLVLLFFICALGGAQGAKLCIKKMSYASDANSSAGFAIGYGCGNSWQIPNWATACSDTVALGAAAYGGPCAAGTWVDSIAGGGGYTYCRQTAPNSDSNKWFCIGPDQNNAAPYWCGLSLVEKQSYLSSFLFNRS